MFYTLRMVHFNGKIILDFALILILCIVRVNNLNRKKLTCIQMSHRDLSNEIMK